MSELFESGRVRELEAELARLKGLINTPETADWHLGVDLEAAHQVERWGAAHEGDKSAERWFWLVGYLAGKALRAHVAGDRDKAKHHTISTGAALRHWHSAIGAAHSGAGTATDADLAALAEPAP